MPIEYVRGNIMETQCPAIVVPVNCRGVMGAGLALQVARRWPDAERRYKVLCRRKEFTPGEVMIYGNYAREPVLVFFATKDNWRRPSHLVWIDRGLAKLADLMPGLWGTSIALPALGCGLGGLPWAEVKPLIVKHLGGSDRRIVVYEPLESHTLRHLKTEGPAI